MATYSTRYTLSHTKQATHHMAELASIVDVMWGGEIQVGPTFSIAICLETADQYIETMVPERAAVWKDVVAQARRNFPPELYGEKYAVMIMEYDNGTVKAITSKNYIELLRRTNAKAYADAVAAAVQDGAAAVVEAAVVDSGNGGEDGAL